MQRLEVSGAVRPLYGSLGVKGLILRCKYIACIDCFMQMLCNLCFMQMLCNLCFIQMLCNLCFMKILYNSCFMQMLCNLNVNT